MKGIGNPYLILGGGVFNIRGGDYVYTYICIYLRTHKHSAENVCKNTWLVQDQESWGKTSALRSVIPFVSALALASEHGAKAK